MVKYSVIMVGQDPKVMTLFNDETLEEKQVIAWGPNMEDGEPCGTNIIVRDIDHVVWLCRVPNDTHEIKVGMVLETTWEEPLYD
jgi:hypothetical protein